MSYVLLPVLAAFTFVLVLVVPLARSWFRDGTVALVAPRSPIQGFLHRCSAGTLVGYGVFTTALAVAGPQALGVVPVSAGVQAVGLAVALAGLAVVVLAQAQMGRSWRIGIEEGTELVTDGLFRYSRNPIYLGMLGLAAGIAIVAPSGWTVLGAVLSYVVVGFQARAEEAHLLREHGDGYARWASRVGRFLPGIGRLTPR